MYHTNRDNLVKEVFDYETTVRKTVGEAIMKINMEMEKYLENIFYAPSTINKILIYYLVGENVDDPRKRYILFDMKNQIEEEEYILKVGKDYKIVKEYDLELVYNDWTIRKVRQWMS